ncbi:PIN domain-containing protein, partial [Akkermansiaceae bacterium]|nr:PIN domain-containing protein [Akkermansiaceae bacterium]
NFGLKSPEGFGKHYVLDTNVLLHEPGCLTRFQDNHLCIPADVLSELDRFTPISASMPAENMSLWLLQMALRSFLKLAHRPKTTPRKRRESLMVFSVSLSKSDTFSSQPQLPKMTHLVVSQVSSRIPTTA